MNRLSRHGTGVQIVTAYPLQSTHGRLARSPANVLNRHASSPLGPADHRLHPGVGVSDDEDEPVERPVPLPFLPVLPPRLLAGVIDLDRVGVAVLREEPVGDGLVHRDIAGEFQAQEQLRLQHPDLVGE